MTPHSVTDVLGASDPNAVTQVMPSEGPPPMSGGEARSAPISLPQVQGYQILDFIGGGGMGDVFRAVQLGTHRTVALKLMRGGFASDRSRLRFDREVELMATLDHPHIARVYDSGLHQGVYFFAMELIQGEPLNEYVETRQLSQREKLELMRTVARAVEHAHQHGVIHRDLKPSNVLVTPDGQPHLLDFGLAKRVGNDDSAQTAIQISKDMEVVGTPAFMSPEQACGETDRVDTRSDVYSLGVMLYQLLTGKPPHDLSGRYDEVIRRVTQEDVVRPRSVSPTIDRDLEALLLKTLARRPEDRYAAAGELARDIDNFLNHEPLIAQPPTTLYFLRKRIRKYALPLSIAAAVVVALAVMALLAFPVIVAGAGGMLLLATVVFAYLRIRHDRDQMTLQRDRMERLLRINDAMNVQPDLPALWGLILTEARGLANADAGSLFLREGEELEFVAAQNQTLIERLGNHQAARLFERKRLPISESSIAGYVAATAKVVNLPDAARISGKLPFRHDSAFDKGFNYQTRSILAVPLKDPQGQVLGVLELINCKSRDGTAIAFGSESEALVTSMASLAAVALRYHKLKDAAERASAAEHHAV